MSVPTIQSRVLENGTWVPRSFGLNEILNAHTKPKEPENEEPEAEHDAVGLLTRSLVHSPVIYWIIPAKVRGRQFNDILLIGENFVTIKEIQKNHQLKDVATKRNFHGRIRHARVFGEPRKPTSDVSPPALLIDEHGNAPSLFPQQILILSLDSGELVFLYAQNTSTDGVKFVSARRDIPAKTSFIEQPGKHVAVDPRSRAMAVAAQQKMFVLFALHPFSEIRSQLWDKEPNSTFDPIKDERIFTVDGIILRMEFLYPESSSQVMLILLISRDGQPSIVIYEWDTDERLRNVRPHPAVDVPVEEEYDIPLLLVPLIPECSFMTVSETKVTIWTGAREGVPRARFVTSLDGDRTSDQISHLWTQWARPVRNVGWSTKRDVLYLAREDGLVKFVEIEGKGQSSNPQITSIVLAGRFNCHIDTAFATLDMGVMSDDFLIAGGDMSTGSLLKIAPRQTPLLVQPLHNWTAISDVCSIPSTIHEGRGGAGSDSLIACTGFDHNGAMTEFRHGLEAQVMLKLDSFKATQRIWAWSDRNRAAVFLVQSSAIESRLWMICDTTDANMPEAQEIDSDLCGADLSSRTLGIAQLKDITVQITTNGIHAFSISSNSIYDQSSPTRYKLLFSCSPDQSIEAVAVNEAYQSIACVLKTKDINSLLLFSSSRDDTLDLMKSAASHDLNFQVSCITFINLDNRLYVALATSTKRVQIYCQNGSDLELCAEISFEDESSSPSDSSTYCETICTLYNTPADHIFRSPRPLLLCGLRNGVLLSLAVRPYEGTLLLQETYRQSLGVAPVILISHEEYPEEVLAHCGDVFCHLSYDKHDIKITIRIVRIWLTNVYETWSQTQKTLVSCRVNKVKKVDAARPLANLICIADGDVHLLSLNKTEDTVPRTFPLHGQLQSTSDPDSTTSSEYLSKQSLGGTPRKIYYSTALDLLVVAYSKICHDLRGVTSSIKLFDLSTGKQVSNDSDLDEVPPLKKAGKSQPIFGVPGERIMGVTDFCYERDGRKSHWLVINTGIVEVRNSRDRSFSDEEGGRLIFLTVTKPQTQGSVEIRKKFIYRQSEPIVAALALRNNLLLWTSNDEIVARALDKNSSRFGGSSSHRVPSRILHMSKDGDCICVSTFNGTFHMLMFDASNHKFKELAVRGPSIPHGLSQHLVLPGSSFVLLSNHRHSKVEVLKIMHEGEEIQTVADIIIPSSILRLASCRLRPQWRPRTNLPVVLHPLHGGQEIIGWKVLRYIQNLAQLCIDSDLDRSTKSQLKVRPEDSEDDSLHIDGDLLATEVVDGGIEKFRKMVQGQDPRLLHGIGKKYQGRRAQNDEAWLSNAIKKIDSQLVGDTTDHIAAVYYLIKELVDIAW